jgi:hypothetical protein
MLARFSEQLLRLGQCCTLAEDVCADLRHQISSFRTMTNVRCSIERHGAWVSCPQAQTRMHK